MTTPDPSHHSPFDNFQQPRLSSPDGSSGTGSGVTSLVLSAVAVLITPPLLFFPYIGFLPVLIAAAGIIVAGSGLRRSTHNTGLTVTGLIVSVIVCILLIGVAAVWTVLVADPAVRDYQELQDVIDHIKNLVGL